MFDVFAGVIHCRCHLLLAAHVNVLVAVAVRTPLIVPLIRQERCRVVQIIVRAEPHPVVVVAAVGSRKSGCSGRCHPAVGKGDAVCPRHVHVAVRAVRPSKLAEVVPVGGPLAYTVVEVDMAVLVDHIAVSDVHARKSL